MSTTSSPNHPPTPLKADFTNVAEHEKMPIHEQDIASPVKPDPELLKGLSFNDREVSRKNDFTEEERTEAWKVVDEAVKTYSDEMVERWIAEMDTLLVYAGLFSAVLTAFNVESYVLLSPPTPDPVLAALTQMSAQIASFSVHGPFVNSTQPAFQPSFVPSNSTSPQRWAVWLNILWFSSLICSLSAASVAIMVKQWIHEYNSGIFGSSRNTAKLRQHRYNGLVKWKMAAIIAVLPILLHIASGLFLAGLLLLLWNLNLSVAIVASVLVGALLAFTLVTIILPTFISNCAYLSPLSTSLFHFCHLPYSHIRKLIYKTAHSVQNNSRSGSILERIMTWLSDECEGSHPPTVHALQWAYVTSHERKLDQEIFLTAYSTTGDMSLLGHASTCFSDHPIDDLSTVLTRIHAQNIDYGQTANSIHWTHHVPLNMASDMLLVRPRNTPGASGETSGQQTSDLQDSADRYLACSNVIFGDRLISYALSNMAAVLYNDGNGRPDRFPMYQCLAALRRQMNSVKETKSALTDAVRRHVIAAIFTVVRTSTSNDLMRNHDACLDILISCSSPSISRAQLSDMVEEDSGRKPLADAIALAEDALTRTLRSKFGSRDGTHRCITIEFFYHYFQHFGLEQLASRGSEKMMRNLTGAVQELHPRTRGRYDEAWKHGLLAWLKSLEKEREKHMTAQQHDIPGTSSRVTRGMFEDG